MTQNIKYLGKAGNDLLAELLVREQRVFSYGDAVRIAGQLPGLRGTLSSLVKGGWLQRIENGKYMITPLEAGSAAQWSEPEFVVASHLVQPYYIGLQSALNYYGYSEQVSKTVYIVSTRRKFNSRIMLSGVTYRIVNTDSRRFYGLSEVAVDRRKVVISDKEKTIVDCLYLQEYCGGLNAVAQALWYGRRELNFTRLARYAARYGNKAVCQRLGYLLETLKAGDSRAVELLLGSISGSYARLDTLSAAGGKYVSRWKLQVNVDESDLARWRFDR